MDSMLRKPAVRRWTAGGQLTESDALAVEEPLEIRVIGQPIAVTMRTPGEDEAPAARIPAVCAVSTPSALPVDPALEGRMILVGFLRGDCIDANAGADRIVD